MSSRWILFDAMGVIFTVGDDTSELLVPFVQARNPKIDAVSIQSLHQQATRGKIAPIEFWSRVGLDANYPAVLEEYLRTLTLDPRFLEAAQRLKAEYRLGMAANGIVEWAGIWQRLYGLEGLFEISVMSSEIGHRQPCPEMFLAFLSRSGAQPEDCAFIDDMDQNLDTASRLGFRTIRFNRTNNTGPCRCSKCITAFDELPLSLEDVFLED